MFLLQNILHVSLCDAFKLYQLNEILFSKLVARELSIFTNGITLQDYMYMFLFLQLINQFKNYERKVHGKDRLKWQLMTLIQIIYLLMGFRTRF